MRITVTQPGVGTREIEVPDGTPITLGNILGQDLSYRVNGGTAGPETPVRDGDAVEAFPKVKAAA